MTPTKDDLDVLLEELTLFEKRDDGVFVQASSRRTRKLKNAPPPIIEVIDQEDESDPLASLLKIIKDGSFMFVPWEDCVEDARDECAKYDTLVGLSREFEGKHSKREQEAYSNPPDIAYLRSLRQECKACLVFQHQDRKKQNRPWRRLGRWLKRTV